MANDERAARDALNLADESLNTPSIRAARHPDSAILEHVFQQSLSNMSGRRNESETRELQ
jgi:hypothetical protein